MNDNPYLNDVTRSGAAGMSGFVLGALVGAGLALLFAPAAGTDTRRRLGDTARRLGTAARDRFNEGKEYAREHIGSSREGFEAGRQGESGRQGAEPRREPVPSTGTTPGQTGGRTAPGKVTPQGSTYTP